MNGFVYDALHYAGPTLTAANVKKGLFAAPVSRMGRRGPPSAYGNAAGLPYPEYTLFGLDSAMIWWNPARDRTGERSWDTGHRQVHVPLGWCALRLRGLSEVRAQVLRPEGFGRPRATWRPNSRVTSFHRRHRASGAPVRGAPDRQARGSGVVAEPCGDPLDAARRAGLVGFVHVAVTAYRAPSPR